MVHSQLAFFREKSEIAARSIEKDAELQQSTKKVKEDHRGELITLFPLPLVKVVLCHIKRNL